MLSSSTKPVIVIVPSDKLPYVTVPVVVIALEPLSIAPKPLVIVPLLRAPTVVTLLSVSNAPSKYVSKSVSATCFIVPASLTTTLSASARVVAEADVSPSIIFNSVAVEFTPVRSVGAIVILAVPSND